MMTWPSTRLLMKSMPSAISSAVVVQGRGGGVCPVLAVLGLEVEDHQDHTVVSAQVQGIIVIAQLLLESLAGCHQIVQRLGDLGNASLVKGGHVPVEDTAGHGDGHALLSVCHVAGSQLSLIPLRQIQIIGGAVQVDERLAVLGIVVQPVPVDLADILRHAAGKLGGHGILPAGPCGKGGVDGDAAVLSGESLDGILVCVVTRLAAPPAHGQGNGVAAQAADGLNRSSCRGRSRSGAGSRAAVAAAGSQQTGCTHSASDLDEIATRNCLAHFCSPPNDVENLVWNGASAKHPLYTIMITKAFTKRKIEFGVIHSENAQILS